jgi:CheY-like chemotaxis protein
VPLEAHRDPEAAGSPDVDGLFVMIVDDEQDSRFALQGLLTDWGCLVLTAGSGDEAVASLANRIRAPEALLLDYRLPGETGVQIAQRLQSTLDRETPVLMVTGDVAAESILEIRRSGFVSMHKPVNPAALRIWLAGVKTQLVDSELNT